MGAMKSPSVGLAGLPQLFASVGGGGGTTDAPPLDETLELLQYEFTNFTYLTAPASPWQAIHVPPSEGTQTVLC